jgi:spore germination protein GerM
VTINSIKISGNTATIDLSPKLDENMGGSCRVSAIRSQITNTAKQFANIKKVIISINGETELILQP